MDRPCPEDLIDQTGDAIEGGERPGPLSERLGLSRRTVSRIAHKYGFGRRTEALSSLYGFALALREVLRLGPLPDAEFGSDEKEREPCE